MVMTDKSPSREPIPPGTSEASSSNSAAPNTSTLTGKSSMRELVRVLDTITSSKFASVWSKISNGCAVVLGKIFKEKG